MKNMCELPKTSKIFTFDMKGSTVDRIYIRSEETLTKIKNGDGEELEKVRDQILKDRDFTSLDLKFKLNKSNADLLRKMIVSDSIFLKDNYVTDYSVLVTIHHYQNETIDEKSSRIMLSTDRKFLYNFSIIDFLGVSYSLINFRILTI